MERGVASRGARLVTARLGRYGTPPAGHYDGARCDRSGRKSGEGSAAPGPKIATVERREAGGPPRGAQGGGSQTPGVSEHAERGVCTSARTALRAPPTPPFGCAKQKQKPGAKNTPRGRNGLF